MKRLKLMIAALLVSIMTCCIPVCAAEPGFDVKFGKVDEEVKEREKEFMASLPESTMDELSDIADGALVFEKDNFVPFEGMDAYDIGGITLYASDRAVYISDPSGKTVVIFGSGVKNEYYNIWNKQFRPEMKVFVNQLAASGIRLDLNNPDGTVSGIRDFVTGNYFWMLFHCPTVLRVLMKIG